MITDNINKIIKELPSGVQLVAVSKYHPASAIAEAFASGQKVFGESRPQELQKKVYELDNPDIQWHFIGHLQTNKLNMVLPYVSMVESVDSVHLLEEIDKWGRAHDRTIDVLLEMHIASEDTKQGFTEEDLLDFLFKYTDNPGKFPAIRLRGLMGMASNADNISVIDADFERIDSYMAYLVDLFGELKDFNQLSIGMSSDWPVAVKHGATIVRLGSAIFGDHSLGDRA